MRASCPVATPSPTHLQVSMHNNSSAAFSLSFCSPSLLGMQSIRVAGVLKTQVCGVLRRKTPCCASAKFTLPEGAFQLHGLERGPSREVVVTRRELLHYYGDMVTIREMERETRNLYQQKKIRGFCHLYTGQEACAVGIEAAISMKDPVITAYRCHGWAYTRGIPINNILAELTGRSTGCAKGKGGSAHMYAENLYGGHGIVGAQVPLGTGVAFALKYKSSNRICVVVYGDGAANQGQVFESFNMAALWRLPCLFVCENNHYGMGTSHERAAACTQYYTRGDYIPGIYVSGQDILAVREATRWCVDYIQAGKGPVILELDTYRFHGHSMSDPGKSYRPPGEIEAVRRERDPIKLTEAYAIEGNLFEDIELQAVTDQAKRRVQEAVTFALYSSELPIKDTYSDVYSADDSKMQHTRGCEPAFHDSSRIK